MTNEVINLKRELNSGITPEAIAACPHLANILAEAEQLGTINSGLVKASQVVLNNHADSPLAIILDWVKSYLAKPHPDLGRKGPVCPFVPNSLELDYIWLAEVKEETPTIERVGEIITDYCENFMATEPVSAPESMNKAFLIVFPTLGEEGAAFVDKVQFKLKKQFVEQGLMLGEFHSKNQSPGLRNPDFKPLRSPIPMLAIRHMVDTDLPFLVKEDYPAEERASFLRSYLTHLGGGLSSSKFDHALNSVIEAEIQKSRELSNQVPQENLTTQLHVNCSVSEKELEPSL